MNTLLVVVCAICCNVAMSAALTPRHDGADSSAPATGPHATAADSNSAQKSAIELGSAQLGYNAYSPEFLDTYINNPQYLQTLYEVAAQYRPTAPLTQADSGEPSSPPDKRAQTFVRFGKRAQTFVRFGKRAQTFVRFG